MHGSSPSHQLESVCKQVPQASHLPKPNLPNSEPRSYTNDEDDYDEVKPSTLRRKVPLNDTPKTPHTPYLGRENDQTVIDLRDSGTNLVMESTDLDLSTFETDDENRELENRAALLRQDLVDKISGVDDSIHNYEELLRIGQINLDERDNALKNLEDNTRKLEQDYTKAKSEG